MNAITDTKVLPPRHPAIELFARYRVVFQAERVSDPMLHLARVLGAGMDPPLVLLQRQRVLDTTVDVACTRATCASACHADVMHATIVLGVQGRLVLPAKAVGPAPNQSSGHNAY